MRARLVDRQARSAAAAARTALGAALLLLYAGARPAAAQTTLIFERTPLRSTPAVLDPGEVYLEAGGVYQEAGGGRDAFAAAVLRAQVGLLPGFEVEAGALMPSWFDEPGASGQGGVGDGYLAGRARLWDGDGAWPTVGLEAGMALPIAQDRDLGSGKVDFFDAALLLEAEPADDLVLGLHAGVLFSRDLDRDARAYTPQPYVIGAIHAGPWAIQPFLEVAWFSTRGAPGGDVAIAAVGAYWTVADGLWIDASAIAGLTPAAPDWGASLGVGILLGPLLWGEDDEPASEDLEEAR